MVYLFYTKICGTHRRVVHGMLFTITAHSPLSWNPYLSHTISYINTQRHLIQSVYGAVKRKSCGIHILDLGGTEKLQTPQLEIGMVKGHTHITVGSEK